MADDSPILIVKDSKELMSEFLKSSVGLYINEKASGVLGETPNKEIKKGIEDTLGKLLDGLAKPKELFDKDNKPIPGVKQRGNQAEIEEAVTKIKKDLPAYVEYMDKAISVDTEKMKKDKEFKDIHPDEVLVRAMQKAGDQSIFMRTSKIISEKPKDKEINEKHNKILRLVSSAFKKNKVLNQGKIIDKIVESRSVSRDARDIRDIKKVLKSSSDLIQDVSSSIKPTNTISNKSKTEAKTR